jgi:hypothetical protein
LIHKTYVSDGIDSGLVRSFCKNIDTKICRRKHHGAHHSQIMSFVQSVADDPKGSGVAGGKGDKTRNRVM